MKIYLGTSGWYYEHWKKKFYPEKISKKEWLKHYCQQFKTVEVNATYYRLPKEKTIKSWYDKSPDDFLFALKGSRIITHIKKLNQVKREVKKFYQLSKKLKNKFGPVLWQLPPQQHLDLEKLKKFLKVLKKIKHENVVEFRHNSWFCPEVYELLKEYKTALCIISHPKLPTKREITAKFTYLRWHGQHSLYASKYSKEELKKWANWIKKFKKKGVKKVYGYFNNDFNAYAVKNCLELKKKLVV